MTVHNGRLNVGWINSNGETIVTARQQTLSSAETDFYSNADINYIVDGIDTAIVSTAE